MPSYITKLHVAAVMIGVGVAKKPVRMILYLYHHGTMRIASLAFYEPINTEE